VLFVSRDERARFDQFFIEEIKRGALPFAMPDPGTDNWALFDDTGADLLTDGSEPIKLAEDFICLFSSLPEVSHPGGVTWRISFSLTVLE